ncbi:MAG TPA: S41 family peptidase [Steroidobacteraceae bacterium]|nr:S41 family peptidase [Steroidobacteraceae bacterium]
MIFTGPVRCLALLAASSIFAACGGGGGGSTGSTGTTPPPAGWVQGQFQPEANFAAMCVAPRTGIDPGTQKAYPDRQGTLLDEQNWLRSWNNDLYLWFDEVTDQNPANFASDATYFNALMTTQTTVSGKPKDRFHFTYATSFWESLSQSGITPGYGATLVVIAATPPREVIVSYTQPGTGATTAPANLARGAKLLAIDGVDLVNATDQASVDILNAGLSPQTVGESHMFSVLDAGASVPRTITLVSANVVETPVQNVHTITAPNGTLVGYMLFNDHIATAESELIAAFSQLQSAAVQDLVLDIRYNGGGYLDIASEVAYMVAGPAITTGQTFDLEQFNSKYTSVDPVTGAAITPVGFHSTTQGFSTTAGQALPTLNLSRVFVLTTSNTCSASEAIINGLRGVNVQVIEIGSTTCGKPYGFYPADNCGTTYFSIQFQGINAQGFGNYPDGFTPQNALAPEGVLLPGCSVADDFTHQLGDSAEGILASALSYQSNGVCPVPPSGMSMPPGLAANAAGAAYVPPIANGNTIKSIWRQNRISRPRAP